MSVLQNMKAEYNFDCGSGSCQYAIKKGGMRVTGPCSCFDMLSQHKTRYVHRLEFELNKMEAELEAAITSKESAHNALRIRERSELAALADLDEAKADLEAANEKIKELLGGEEAWLAFCDAENTKKENVKLKAELEAEKKENKVLNKALKLTATRATQHLCPDEDDCVEGEDCEEATVQDCVRCWLDYFRAEAEKGSEEC